MESSSKEDVSHCMGVTSFRSNVSSSTIDHEPLEFTSARRGMLSWASPSVPSHGPEAGASSSAIGVQPSGRSM